MKKRPFFIILLIMISISLSFLYNFVQIQDDLYNKQQISLTSDLANTAIDFNRWINNKIKMLETTKDIINNLNYDEITYQKILNKYLKINLNDGDISEVYIGLSNGEFVTGGKWIPPKDYDPRKRVWYIEAVNKDKTVISSIYIDRETGEKLVTISSPLYLKGKFIGVISADIFLDNLNGYLKKMITNDNNYVYIINSKGVFTAHTKKPELINKSLYEMNNIKLNKLLENQEKYNNIRSINYKIDSKNIIAVVSNLSNIEWYFVIATEKNSFFSIIRNISPGIIFFNTLIIGIVLLLFRHLIIYEKNMIDNNRDLKEKTEIDFLTKINNRRYFDYKSNEIWEESVGKKMSVIMIDIDYFKKYNDHYGHSEGDKVLKNVCVDIKNNIRKEDIFARYGGEEFIIFLEGVGEKKALFIAETIRTSIYNLNITHSKSPFGRLTISLGVKSIKSTGKKVDYHEFLLRVDENLYKAKESGRNKTMCDTLY